jgi:hypothetical protein
METKTEQTRVRIAYKVSAKGQFQPDVTAEAETVETAMSLMKEAHNEIMKFAKEQGTAE